MCVRCWFLVRRKSDIGRLERRKGKTGVGGCFSRHIVSQSMVYTGDGGEGNRHNWGQPPTTTKKGCFTELGGLGTGGEREKKASIHVRSNRKAGGEGGEEERV